jgi:ATP-dependent Clp protease ATP-binding subunit ClpC
LRHAQTEAESYHHEFIGTEHLLLGLLHDSENLAVRVLGSFGVEATTMRAAVEHQLNLAPAVDPSTRGLTARSKRAIELSVEEANALRHSWIGTEHLLLGLLHEGGGIAAGALREVGLTDLDDLRRRVKLLIEERA